MERALTKVCDYINNYFESEIHGDVFAVENNTLICPFLANGQYFRIKGSIFNDGIHQYPAHDLKDETFRGEVWALAIPQTFVEIVDEITAYEENPANAPTGYTSESFGGYSYTRGTNDHGTAATWQDVFRSRLNRYRKVW